MVDATKSNPSRARKRVEVETTSLKRARDGSAFTRCEVCNKDVPVGLIDMHSCSLDSRIKMNLEAQIVENVTEVKKPADRKISSQCRRVRKKAASSEPKAKNSKKEKKVKDPNMPKRAPTAFFLFMDDFRKEYKEANPDSKSVSTVAKEGGEKWKSMTDAEKKPYLEKSLELRAEYEKAMEKYNAGNEEEQVVLDGED